MVCILLSKRSPTDIEYVYKNAYALVYPSYSERFGYPPIEAMKHGTPILSASVCSMPEVLKDAAYIFRHSMNVIYMESFSNWNTE